MEAENCKLLSSKGGCLQFADKAPVYVIVLFALFKDQLGYLEIMGYEVHQVVKESLESLVRQVMAEKKEPSATPDRLV